MSEGLGDRAVIGRNRSYLPGSKQKFSHRRRKYSLPAIQPHTHTQLMAETETGTIEKTFDEFTQRKDIAILLINQHALTHYKREPKLTGGRLRRRYDTRWIIIPLRSLQFWKYPARNILMVTSMSWEIGLISRSGEGQCVETVIKITWK